jgi:hypothetical protein
MKEWEHYKNLWTKGEKQNGDLAQDDLNMDPITLQKFLLVSQRLKKPLAPTTTLS